jgi:hypothetical protein
MTARAKGKEWLFTFNFPNDKKNGERITKEAFFTNQFFRSPMLKVDRTLLEEWWNDGCRYTSEKLCPGAIDINSRIEVSDTKVRFLIFQLERGKHNRLHVQGYIEFKEPVSMGFLTKLNGAKWLFGETVVLKEDVSGPREYHYQQWLKLAKASRADNEIYCSKSGPGGRVPGTQTMKFVNDDPGTDPALAEEAPKRERDDKGRSGARSIATLALRRETLKQTINFLEDCAKITDMDFEKCLLRLAKKIFETDPTEQTEELQVLLGVNHYLKTHRESRNLFLSIKANAEMEKAKQGIVELRKVVVQVFVGATGTGKTYQAYCGYQYTGGVYIKNSNYGYWDGYNGQKVLVLDEFRGHTARSQGTKAYLTVDVLQRLLDGYPFDCDIKGKTPISAKWNMVIICTNWEIDRWFDDWSGISLAVKNSILSRITLVKRFEGENRRDASQASMVVPEAREAFVSYTTI